MTSARQAATALDVIDIGTVPVAEFVAKQAEVVQARIAGSIRDSLIVVRHPPTVTYPAVEQPYLLLDDAQLAARGIALARVTRGGGALYVDPGYLCLCPVADIARFGDVAEYPDALEAIAIRTLNLLGLQAHHRPGWSGVWIDNRKLATIGATVRRGIASFGVCLNVSADLDLCAVVPRCGADCGTHTSLSSEFGSGTPDSAQLVTTFVRAWQEWSNNE